jgi:tetratricopeptide (TPR) repeat protein
MEEANFEKQLFWGASIVLAILSFFWSLFLGGFNVELSSMAIALFSSAFAIGSLVGFIFTIFGEEIEPFGKIRNSMVAVASGVAGLSIAKAAEMGGLIGKVRIFNTPPEQSSWFSVMVVTIYVIAGFYFMYLLRKIVLNPMLAKSQKEIERFQISGSVSAVTIEVEKAIPQSLLLGREYIADTVEDDGPQAKELDLKLFSKTVVEFLKSCEDDLQAGVNLGKDIIERAGMLYYYQSYFKKEDREARIEKAIEWVGRTLVRDPLNIAFSIKLGDLYWMQDRYDETVAIFERLVKDPDSPQYSRQWLGYYLLYIDGRENDAIESSLKYFGLFPTEPAALFNASCGYAQLYLLEQQKPGATPDLSSDNRDLSLSSLRRAIRMDSDFKKLGRKYAEIGDSFEALISDKEFRTLIDSSDEAKTNPIL